MKSLFLRDKETQARLQLHSVEVSLCLFPSFSTVGLALGLPWGWGGQGWVECDDGNLTQEGLSLSLPS